VILPPAGKPAGGFFMPFFEGEELGSEDENKEKRFIPNKNEQTLENHKIP